MSDNRLATLERRLALLEEKLAAAMTLFAEAEGARVWYEHEHGPVIEGEGRPLTPEDVDMIVGSAVARRRAERAER